MSDEHIHASAVRYVLAGLTPPLLIAVGAFVGANLRFAVGASLPGLAGTLAANVAGSVALGLLLYRGTFAGRLSQKTRLLVGTGALSSFTTYSTFLLDAVGAEPLVALMYVVTTYALGFAGVVVGREIARSLAGGEE